MRHILVPILSTADVAAVPELVKLLRLLKPLATVVVNNPSVGVTAESATATVDKQIAELERAKTDAANREDYEGAKAYKVQIEDAKMKRTDILRDGWKSVPQADRNKTYDTLFVDAFNGLPFVRSITLTEDTTPENLLSTLANFGSSWPECLPSAQWAIVWPRSVAPITLPAAQPEPVSHVARVETAPPAKKAAPAPQLSPRAAREKELGYYMKLKAEAKKHGIAIQGRPSKEVVAEIIAKEFPEAVAV